MPPQSINQFQAIGLTELDQVSLLNRIDTKFVFPKHLLDQVLLQLAKDYYILEIEDTRVHNYESVYYDTDDRLFYNDHHNRRGNRAKVRYRHYIESGLVYFEIKLKNNKGRTIKERRKLSTYPKSMGLDEKALVNQKIHPLLANDLIPALEIFFSRITLAEKNYKERATIDIGLHFKQDGKLVRMDNWCIAELKQAKVNRNSPMMDAFKKLGIRSNRFSKYCMGILQFEKHLKYNRFKSKMRQLETN